MRRFFSFLLLIVFTSTAISVFPTTIYAAETDDCGAKITPAELTTNSTVIEKITIDLSKLGFPTGNKYIVNVNGVDAGSRYYANNSPEPRPKDPDIFTLSESKIIEVSNLGPLGAHGANTDINGRTATFQGESLIVKVYPESERLSFFHPDFLRGKALCQSSFLIKKIPPASACTITPYKKKPALSPVEACTQQCNPLSDPRDEASCAQQCATATPSPLQTALANSFTSEDEIFIKVGNLSHQEWYLRRSDGKEKFRLVLKRESENGDEVGGVADPERSYEDLTQGNVSLPKLEAGLYNLEIKDHVIVGEAILSAVNKRYCQYDLRIVKPGEIGGGIENTFKKASFLPAFCSKKPDKDEYVCDTAIGPIDTNFPDLIKKIFAVLLSLSGGIAVLLIIAAGYALITSSGNPEKTQAAKERLTSAIVGLLFIIFSFVILEVIGVSILKIPGIG